jgi:hypothetical protein
MIMTPRAGSGPGAAANEETMSAFANSIALVALSLGLQTAIAAADSPPTLNVGPSCDAAARGSVMLGRDKEACLGDERTAQDTLKQNWSKFNAADKTQCIGNVKSGGPASYVELLSCLEIMRDAKAIRETDPGIPSDQVAAPAGRRRR